MCGYTMLLFILYFLKYDKLIFVSIVSIWTSHKSTTYHNFPHFPIYIFLYQRKYISAVHTQIHWKVIKWYLMPWHIICYQETSCLLVLFLFSFISNHFQLNHLYILFFLSCFLRIPIIILLGKGKNWNICIIFLRVNGDMWRFHGLYDL